MKPIVESLAHDFLAQTGKRLIVTSGVRTAETQASAMKIKLDLKDDLHKLYSNASAVNEVIDAYNCATPADREKATSQTIKRQMDRGVFISQHLTGGGVDFHLPSGNDNRAFRLILSEHKNLHVIPEGKPPHIHIQLKNTK